MEADSGTRGRLFSDQKVTGGTSGSIRDRWNARLLSKECRAFGFEGLHLVWTHCVGCEGRGEYLLILTSSDPEEAIKATGDAGEARLSSEP